MKIVAQLRKPRSAQQHDERGAAAIVITMVIMVVIALVVLGFASVSRREQRQALDAQLQTQAFYAAESGINDAKKIINDTISTGVSLQKDDCSSGGPAYSSLLTGSPLTGSPTSDDGVMYTCVLVNDKPDSLVNNSVTDSVGWVVPVNTVRTDGTPETPTDFTVSWRPATQPSGSADCSSIGNGTRFNPTAQRPCLYPVLRIDLVNVNGRIINSSGANGQLTTFYMQPNIGSTDSFVYALSVDGRAVVGRVGCASDYSGCRATITGALTSGMAMRVTSLYGASSVTIESSRNGSALRFSGGQIIIDSTGRAQDVLRRIQVRIPVDAGAYTPAYALQSGMSICKRFTTYNNFFSIDSGIDSTLKNTDPMCGQ